jgi:PAS domain S-box-containing protein
VPSRGADFPGSDWEGLTGEILEAVREGALLLDENRAVLRGNSWAVQHLGRGRDGGIVGLPVDDVLPDSVRGPLLEGLQTEASAFVLGPCGYPSEDQSDLWLDFTVTRLSESGLHGVRYFVQVRDLSVRREAERRLTEEIARRRLLVEQSRDGIVILDGQGKVQEANRRFAQMLGYTMGEMKSLTVWDWEALYPHERTAEMVTTVDESGDHFVSRHRRKDGSAYDVEISTNAAVFGEEKYIFCVCRDITEQKREAEEKEALIGELQAALAEIKTLRGLVPVCAYCGKLRDDDGYWQQVDVYLAKHAGADVTHGICPDCMQQRFPELCDGE